MENRELKKILTYLSEAYPMFIVTAAKFSVWVDGVGDINGELVFKAVQEHIRESKFAPSVAEIRSLCSRLIDPFGPAADAWDLITKRISQYGSYRINEAVSDLDYPTVEALNSVGGFSRLCMLEIRDLEKLRQRFEEKYNQAKTENIKKLLSSERLRLGEAQNE